jgi:hypothetical protein
VQLSGEKGVPVICHFYRETTVSHYLSRRDGSTLSVPEWTESMLRLDRRSKDSCGERLPWRDDQLEDQIAHDVFYAEWIPVHREIITSTPCVVVVKDQIVSGHSDIRPVCYAGGSIVDPVFVYEPDMRMMFRRIAARYGMKEKELGSSYENTKGFQFAFSRSGGVLDLEYTVGFGTYIFSSREGKCSVFRGTMEACLEEKNRRERWLDGVIRVKVAREVPKDAAVWSREMIDLLAGALQGARTMDVFKKGYDQKRRVVAKLEKVLKSVVDAAATKSQSAKE